MPITEEDIQTLGNVLMGKLMGLTIRRKLAVASMAGIDTSKVLSAQDNFLVNTALTQAFGTLTVERKRNALPVLADELMATYDDTGRKELTRLLHHHGYEYINGSFVPVGLIDEREKRYVRSHLLSSSRGRSRVLCRAMRAVLSRPLAKPWRLRPTHFTRSIISETREPRISRK